MRSRLEASVLLAVIALGCQATWLLVPVSVLWAVSRLSSSVAVCFFVALAAIPTLIVALVWLLGLVDRRYVLVRRGRRAIEEDDELGLRSGPLEAILPISITLALIGVVIWFLVLAPHLPIGHEQLIP